MTLSAPRNSGKSFLLSTMMRAGCFDHFDYIFILCPSLDFNDDYWEFHTDKRVTFISEPCREVVEEIFQQQVKVKRMLVARRRHQDPTQHSTPLFMPKTLVIMDDCIDSGILNFRGSVDKIAERGRHLDISSCFCVQRSSALSRSIRLNTNYFIIFAPYAVAEMEKFLAEFVSKDKQARARSLFATVFEKPFQFIVLDNNEKGVYQRIKESNAYDFISGRWDILPIHEETESEEEKFMIS